MEEVTIREVLSGHVHTRQRGSGMEQVPEYPHVYFSNLEHYKEALTFAEKLGGEALESFKENLESLNRMCENWDETAEVHPDFVQHSFYFRMYRDGKPDMDGGIILHGLGETFSVELCPPKGVHWSMHT